MSKPVITLARIVSALALAGTLLPAIFLLAGRVDLPAAKSAMLAATVAWFIATPIWMDREETTRKDGEERS